MRLTTIALTLALSALPLTSRAGDMNNAQHMHGTGHMAEGSQSASSKAFNDAMMKMHEKMSTQMSGDADVDFVKRHDPAP